MDDLHELATQVAQRILGASDEHVLYDLGVGNERSRGEAELIALAEEVLRQERGRSTHHVNNPADIGEPCSAH
jgi:hypothetical protein